MNFKKYILFLITVVGVLFTLLVNAADLPIDNTNFKDLFNNYRKAQPNNIPWAGTFWAYANNGIDWPYIDGAPSPAGKYDAFIRANDAAGKWERTYHTCNGLGDKEAGCRGWWGHCNAWSAAAIKEEEPRESVTINNSSGTYLFRVGDLKGYITERWMDDEDYYITGKTNKGLKTGQWVFDKSSQAEAFWDVTPRTFFLLFTNYIGLLKTGIAIDRFTGDQVWNQPISGYIIHPLTSNDIGSRNAKGQYPVTLTMIIFWANDNVGPDHISSKFNINSYPDNYAGESHDWDYASRVLRFTLYFDDQVQVSSDGKQILSAGKLVGDGVWAHRNNPSLVKSLDQGHPDFIWIPGRLPKTPKSGNKILSDFIINKIITKRTINN